MYTSDMDKLSEHLLRGYKSLPKEQQKDFGPASAQELSDALQEWIASGCPRTTKLVGRKVVTCNDYLKKGWKE